MHIDSTVSHLQFPALAHACSSCTRMHLLSHVGPFVDCYCQFPLSEINNNTALCYILWLTSFKLFHI